MSRILTLASTGLMAIGLAVMPVSVFAQSANGNGATMGTDSKPAVAAPVVKQDGKAAAVAPAAKQDSKAAPVANGTAKPATDGKAGAAKGQSMKAPVGHTVAGKDHVAKPVVPSTATPAATKG